MNKKIKILHLETDTIDAERVNRILGKGGIASEIVVIDKKKEYIEALMQFSPDVILSDHTLSSFNAREALNILLQSGMKIPFILVNAKISEDTLFMIKAGAHDYVLKGKMNKLPEAIISALEKIESDLNGANKQAINIKEKTNAVIIAQEIERNQVAYELLENINQILTVSNLYIDHHLSGNDTETANVQNGKKYILLAIDEIKKLTHLITPPSSGEIGLTDSIDNWIQHKRQTNLINIVTGWKHINERVIAKQLQLTIYRIIQEQINNIIKYANAQNIHISLEQTVDALWLMIKEDGPGVDMSKITDSIVLQNINTRSEIHNGRMMFESKRGKGSVLSIVFPDSELSNQSAVPALSGDNFSVEVDSDTREARR